MQELSLKFSQHPGLLVLLIVLAIWSIVWKAIALWKSARNTHKAWFVILLIVNSVGILDIIYIYLFSKKQS